MEIVKNLKREKKRRSLSKLKLDVNKTVMQNLEKIISFLSKDLKEYNLENTDPSKYLKFNNFRLKVIKVTDKNLINNISKMFANRDEVPVYEGTLTDNDGNAVELYILPTVKIAAKNRKYYFRLPSPKDRKRILDINYLYGVLKVFDIVYDEVKENPSIYLSRKFQHISIFKESYSEGIFYGILEILFKSNLGLYCIKGINPRFYISVLKLIVDVIAIMQNVDLNIELAEKYNSDTNSECARAFETKKNIPQKILKVMKNTTFLKDFSYVELDEDTDISKFHLIEKEWIKVKKALNLEKYLDSIKPELRFKKLGKHRALGLYYPTLNCICVDITSPSSFLHEFGHFIDYTNKKGQYSLKYEFFPLIEEYKKSYNSYILKNRNSEAAYLTRKKNYFFTPTEIFARCFEIYLVNKGVKNSFLKEKENLIVSLGYPEINNYFLDLINNYFDKIIKINLLDLEKEENQTIKNDVEYIEPIVSSTGQLIFAI